MKILLGLAIALAVALPAHSEDLVCIVSAKADTTRIGVDNHFVQYSKTELERMQFSVIIRDDGDAGSRVARCSFQESVNDVTCDTYDVDYVARDQYVGHKKYYFFQGQFDVQVFADKTFVENNGRGSFAYGYCLTP
jgi:hypothetical protein